MKILHTTLLAILVAGCTAPENPPNKLPVANPDPSATSEVSPVNPPPVAKPRLDPVTALKRLDAVLETDDEGNILSLTASGPLIVDEVLEQIGAMKTLLILNLEYTEITDAGLAHLVGLSNIRTLVLRGTEITDEGLAQLESLTTLTELDLEFAAVSNEGVGRLQKALPGCTINH
tara:strand:+ start:153 stop:677 length:525 start_codon:yes stop_codon:yes gene_type:complete